MSGVAAGLVDAGAEVPLGILPTGTGNDFALGLGVPCDARAALAVVRRALRCGRIGRVDLIECATPGRPDGPAIACNAVVGGLGGRSGDLVTPALRRRWRRFAYLRAGLPELARLRSHRVSLLVDERNLEVDALMVVVANTPRAGGGLRLAPDADPRDGRISLVVIRAVPALRVPGLAARVVAGRHLRHDAVLGVRARHVEVAAGPEFRMNRDGETWAAGAAAFRVRPAALRILLPGNAGRP